MLSLLALSLVLSSAATAVEPTPGSGAESFSKQQFVLPKTGSAVDQESAKPLDDIEVQRSGDICYKIRAFIFSQGRNPKFLRETTCGPTLPKAKQTDGFKFMPLENSKETTPK
jgi:hypothetical protein